MSPKDPGHSDIKYVILRYRHQYIRLVIRYIAFLLLEVYIQVVGRP